ncbi:uncharacterized protein LOC5508924 isoform X1 [Nematostella vectensis]|uniref:uncharacterized protein LOC5508924 isoform X1 n=2 Tax=Nematostella vectensis TaxID=45351 RepID=UPI00138FD644|nr:uncharacterized protein LOC5508924 isoform X1 [Nematostella vectensis]
MNGKLAMITLAFGTLWLLLCTAQSRRVISPERPVVPNVTVTGPSEIKMNWCRVRSNNVEIDHYELFIDNELEYSGIDVMYVAKRLKPWTAYEIKLRACGFLPGASCSLFSRPLLVKTLPNRDNRTTIQSSASVFKVMLVPTYMFISGVLVGVLVVAMALVWRYLQCNDTWISAPPFEEQYTYNVEPSVYGFPDLAPFSDTTTKLHDTMNGVSDYVLDSSRHTPNHTAVQASVATDGYCVITDGAEDRLPFNVSVTKMDDDGQQFLLSISDAPASIPDDGDCDQKSLRRDRSYSNIEVKIISNSCTVRSGQTEQTHHLRNISAGGTFICAQGSSHVTALPDASSSKNLSTTELSSRDTSSEHFDNPGSVFSGDTKMSLLCLNSDLDNYLASFDELRHSEEYEAGEAADRIRKGAHSSCHGQERTEDTKISSVSHGSTDRGYPGDQHGIHTDRGLTWVQHGIDDRGYPGDQVDVETYREYPGDQQGIVCVIDNSNIYIGAQECASTVNVGDKKRHVRVKLQNLVRILERGRPKDRCFVCGSSPPATEHVWEVYRHLGYIVDLEERRGKNEQRVDEGLHLCIYKAICELSPRVLVLATGDGTTGKSENATSFPGCATMALDRGWHVELYSWKHALSTEWTKLARKHPDRVHIHFLDKYVNHITFVDGKNGRKCLPLSTELETFGSHNAQGLGRVMYHNG